MRNRDKVLDRLRMLLAVLVVICHIHYFEEIFEKKFIQNNWINLPLLLGHQSVIVFFVLSGYFVGGQAYLRYSKEKFQVSHFIVERLTRLWVVLLPALILTYTLNQIVCSFPSESAYCDGKISQGALNLDPTKSNFKVFVGNLFFMQGIRSTVFGSNLPLWSISFEFWFYMSIPILFFVNKLHQIYLKLIALMIAFATSMLLGFPLNWYIWFLCWLMGVLAFYLKRKFLTFRAKAMNSFFLPMLFAFMLGSRLLSGSLDQFAINTVSDLVLSVLCAVMLALKTENNVDSRIKLPEFSFSIYAFHFPLIVFAYFGFRQIFFQKFGEFFLFRHFFPFIVTIFVVASCWALFLITEKHYKRIRIQVFRFLMNSRLKRWF